MEENLEGAALSTVMDAVHPDFVVIGEATGLGLNRGGRGRAEIHLETIGRPAHSSTPHLGRNAVHDMRDVITVVEQLPVRHDPLLGPTVMALTDIMSDPYPAYSVIPSRCRVTYDRRLLPGETVRELLDSISTRPELVGIDLRVTIAQGAHRTYSGATLAGPKFLPAWVFPEDNAFVQQARRGLTSVGQKPAFGAYRFCTNAAYSAGVMGVPTIDPTAPADLVSMNGYIIDGKVHVHMTLTNEEKAFGGHLEAGTEVFTFAVVTLGILSPEADLSRVDDKTYR